MQRLALDLTKESDREKIKGVWRRAVGLIPGEPNQGLIAGVESSPARLPDYDDSGWEITDDIGWSVSKGFTLGWWRINVELPEQIDGQSIAGWKVIFETTVDDYGEVWIDGEIDLVEGTVAGFNGPQRVTVSTGAVPGARHVIACLGANGPFAAPLGGIFMRYATLAFERPGNIPR